VKTWCERERDIMSKLLTIKVTEEQDLALRAFFLFWNWDLEIISETLVNNDVLDLEEGDDHVGEEQPAIPDPVFDPELLVHVPDPVVALPAPVEVHYDGAGVNECAYCYGIPCVTEVRQSWFGKAQKAIAILTI
jgi:hypothetical protein